MATELFIPATQARNNFFSLLQKAKATPFPIHITIKGIPQVVMINKEEFDAWMTTLETLADSELMKSIRKSEEDLRKGRYSPLEEVEEELKLDKDVSSKSPCVSKKRSKKT